MRTVPDRTVAPPPVDDRTRLWRAWTAVAFLPVAFVAAMALGYALYALLGYAPEDGDAPLWVGLVCGVPAIAVFLVPCVAAVHHGLAAQREGHVAGAVAAVVGAVAALWMISLNVVSAFAG